MVAYRSIFLAAVLLSACNTLPPTTTSGRVSVAGAYRSSVALQGRMSVRYMARGKEESVHGNFEWQQQGEQIAITLRSPLGQTLAQIRVHDGIAELTQSGQAPRTARDVDTLISDTLGWPLPVAGLRYWLQGQGKSSDGQAFVATAEHPTITTQDGWHLRYVSWHPAQSQNAPGTGLPAPLLPKRIDLTRTTQEAGDVELRLILDPPDT